MASFLKSLEPNILVEVSCVRVGNVCLQYACYSTYVIESFKDFGVVDMEVDWPAQKILLTLQKDEVSCDGKIRFHYVQDFNRTLSRAFRNFYGVDTIVDHQGQIRSCRGDGILPLYRYPDCSERAPDRPIYLDLSISDADFRTPDATALTLAYMRAWTALDVYHRQSRIIKPINMTDEHFKLLCDIFVTRKK
jgi:hypothetical protein